MAKKLLFGLLAATLLLVGCETVEAPGGNQPPVDETPKDETPVLNPVGEYIGSYTWRGDNLTGGFQIEKEGSVYVGYFGREGLPAPIPMDCTVAGVVVSCSAEVEDEIAKFEGSMVDGVWTGEVSAKLPSWPWQKMGEFDFRKIAGT